MKGEPHTRAARLFHLLSHQARLQILDELRRDEACVCHLQPVLGRPQAYVSQQLRALREEGLVTDRREGTLVYYRLADSLVARLLDETLGAPGASATVWHTVPVPAARVRMAKAGHLASRLGTLSIRERLGGPLPNSFEVVGDRSAVAFRPGTRRSPQA